VPIAGFGLPGIKDLSGEVVPKSRLADELHNAEIFRSTHDDMSMGL
jgi:hypothetical protein